MCGVASRLRPGSNLSKKDQLDRHARQSVFRFGLTGGLTMKRRSAFAAALAVFLCASAHAEDKAVSPHELKVKTDYCKTCHGLSGQGFRGSFPMPRLAGQSPEYLQNQLQAFIDRRRTNPVMFNVAHVLNPSMQKALADHFRDLNPRPLGGAPRELVGEGKGADAFPRLAGQLNDYIIKKLTNWDKERGQQKDQPDNSAIMQPIAHDLTEAQIRAVAAYVSYLE